MKTSAKKNKKSASGSKSRITKKTSGRHTTSNSKNQRTKKGSLQKSTSQKPKPGNESSDDLMKKYFSDLLKDTLNAEKQLVRALPKLAKASTSSALKKAFEKHLGETEKQVARLEKVFAACDIKMAGKKCEAMEGLVKEGTEAIEETPKGSLVRDVALIVAAQKVEHYEIAAYGSLRNIAINLGYDKAADLLQKTLDEESAADQKLTDISDSLNPKATKEEAPKSKKTAKAISSKQDDEEKENDEEPEEAVYVDEEEEEGEETPARSGFGNSL